MLYAIDLWDDEKGRSMIPGFGGGRYEANSPIPVPAVGDFIRSFDAKWKVVRLEYEYQYGKNDELQLLISVYCRLAEGTRFGE